MDRHTHPGAASEVARILTQIQAEYESGTRGLSGLASGTTTHRFITARMERIGQLHSALENIVGEDCATALLVSTLEELPEPADTSPIQ